MSNSVAMKKCLTQREKVSEALFILQGANPFEQNKNNHGLKYSEYTEKRD